MTAEFEVTAKVAVSVLVVPAVVPGGVAATQLRRSVQVELAGAAAHVSLAPCRPETAAKKVQSVIEARGMEDEKDLSFMEMTNG